MEKINYLRENINFLDDLIIELLDKRLKIVLEIAYEKQKNKIVIYNQKREKEIIERLKKRKKYYLSNRALEQIYREILNSSVKQMKHFINGVIKDENL